MVKTGLGVDVHQLVKGVPCIIGGVEIESEFGLVGHSDADVVIHAIVDGILGAASLGDIGQWFPDDQQKYKNIDSMLLLKQIYDTLQISNYDITHIDVTVIAEIPKINKYKMDMRIKIANILKINLSQINIKATTTEKLGFIGSEQGVACMAVVNLEERGNQLEFSDDLLNTLSAQSVAYLGDAVFELYIRSHLVNSGLNKANILHKKALDYVSARSQAVIVKDLLEDLSPKELKIFKWGRNSNGGCVPKNADVQEYRYSTGFEALLGYLYLQGDIDRLEELIKYILEKQ